MYFPIIRKTLVSSFIQRKAGRIGKSLPWFAQKCKVKIVPLFGILVLSTFHLTKSWLRELPEPQLSKSLTRTGWEGMNTVIELEKEKAGVFLLLFFVFCFFSKSCFGRDSAIKAPSNLCSMTCNLHRNLSIMASYGQLTDSVETIMIFYRKIIATLWFCSLTWI